MERFEESGVDAGFSCILVLRFNIALNDFRAI
jgi:hypothetical protein